jgi:hypothetical protein
MPARAGVRKDVPPFAFCLYALCIAGPARHFALRVPMIYQQEPKCRG